jgi:hypothetical protein
MREGIVLRNEQDTAFSFKAVDPSFLVKYHWQTKFIVVCSICGRDTTILLNKKERRRNECISN